MGLKESKFQDGLASSLNIDSNQTGRPFMDIMNPFHPSNMPNKGFTPNPTVIPSIEEQKQGIGLADTLNRSAPNHRGTMAYEGFKDKVYTDSTGNATVGFGHKLTPEEIKSGKYANGISKQEAEALFMADKQNHANQFYENYPWAKNLNPQQRIALEDMAFNMGPSFLNDWNDTRSALQSGNFGLASQNIRNSAYAKQVGDRAVDNANLIFAGY